MSDRYGIRWAGPEQPICEPMPDGYWTPWHESQLGLAAAVAAERKRLVEVFTQERARLMLEGFAVGVHYIDWAIQQIEQTA